MINFVKNSLRNFLEGIFAMMKKRILNSTFFKTIFFLILILVLVVSSCGIKHSIKNVCNVEHNSTKTQKATVNCQFVQLAVANNHFHQEVSLEKAKFCYRYFSSTGSVNREETNSSSTSKANSIPLYILYKQLRSDLV